MQNIKGVIFDLDGTLANTLPLCIEAFRKSVEPLIGHSITDEAIINTFGPSEEGTIMMLAPDHYDKGIEAYLHHYEGLHNMCPEPFYGIQQLLNNLKEKDIKIALVTGKGKHSTAISLDYFKLAPFFEIIETGAPSGPVKVAGILSVLNIWQSLQKDEVIYVGDSTSDIQASRQAGIKVIAASWAETAEPEKLKSFHPDEIFYTVEAFSEWLFGINK